MLRQRVLVIGIGNAFRGDDAVGLFAAQQIQAMNLPDVSVVQATGDGAALMETWRGAETVVLIDAVQSGALAGTIYRFDACVESLPCRFFHYSTHAFSLAEAIELARVLNQLPPRLTVYGIEGRSFGAGVDICDEVIRAAQLVVQEATQEILALHKPLLQRGARH